MCGILGNIKYKDSKKLDFLVFKSALSKMERRGPDATGIWMCNDEVLMLGHKRLSIIDLKEDSNQPFKSKDGNLVIVFNGEIYNYQELRKQEERNGSVFYTNSDTEVLLVMYQNHGTEMFKQLRGMYAFAVYDIKKAQLFIARDPFGIKPLYIKEDEFGFSFASQLKALLFTEKDRKCLDEQAIQGYKVWGSISEPNTVKKNIKSFQPGRWQRISEAGIVESGEFDSVERIVNGIGYRPNYLNLREAIYDSVRSHLISDVPVGIFLSGGKDSVVIAGVAAELGAEVETLTLGFTQFKGTSLDETVLAKKVAKHYGLRNHTVWIDEKQFDQILEEYLIAMDQPSIDGLNTWMVSAIAKDIGAKVVLSGLGGDELFGGYPSFSQIPLLNGTLGELAKYSWFAAILKLILNRSLNPKTRHLLKYSATVEKSYLLRRACRMPEELGYDNPEKFMPDSRESIADTQRLISYLELTNYTRNQLLRDSDWASMYHSLELRIPLLDVFLARYVFSLNQSGQKFSKNDMLDVLRKSAPNLVRSKKKTGFSTPVKDWVSMRDKYKNYEISGRNLRGWQDLVLKMYIELNV